MWQPCLSPLLHPLCHKKDRAFVSLWYNGSGMKEFLWKHFVKDYENYKDPEVRGRYTKLTGTLGIIVNSVLCVVKIILGFAINSIAVVADGFHDMADSLAAIITLVASHIARKPADKHHPYGHARSEYLAGLMVSAIVLIVGYQLMRSSITKCLHPEPTTFSWLMVGFMVFAILFKGSSALFTIATGKHINSIPVIAAGTDNRNDVVTSIVILIGMLLNRFAGLELDGYMGCLVSLFVLYSGFQLIRQTIGPLLGEAPDEELVDEITDIILSHKDVLGVHDLIIYNYGPGNTMASFHAEVDAKADLVEIHDVIDHIEREILRKLGINVTCHIDPVELDDPLRQKMQKLVSEALQQFDVVEGIHDLRIAEGKSITRVVFEVELKPGVKLYNRYEIIEAAREAVKSVDENYEIRIVFEQAFLKRTQFID